ncbi:MAG: hypothetical protein AAGI01_06325 [Myxococcota bacterium]
MRFYPAFSSALASALATLAVQYGATDVWPDKLEGVLLELLGVESIETRVHALRVLTHVGTPRSLETLRNLLATSNTLMPTNLDTAAKRAHDAILERHGSDLVPGALTILDETKTQRGALSVSAQEGGVALTED